MIVCLCDASSRCDVWWDTTMPSAPWHIDANGKGLCLQHSQGKRDAQCLWHCDASQWGVYYIVCVGGWVHAVTTVTVTE